ncbi:MAG: hypothetical protein ACRDRV_04205 [Pseudonocardiaceae bacterium]
MSNRMGSDTPLDELPKESHGGVSGTVTTAGTQLTPQNIREMFLKTLREGVEKYFSLLGFGDGASLYREALKFAAITYDNVVTGLVPTLAGQAKLPPAEQVTDTDFVEKTTEELKFNTNILGREAEVHYLEYKEAWDNPQGEVRASGSQPLSQTEYLNQYHQRARVKLAGSWAEPAAAVVRLLQLIQSSEGTSFLDEMKSKTAKRMGRDITGRLAYHLMNVSPKEHAEQLLGLDVKEGVGKQRGTARLGLDIGDSFSNAACHNDAQKMIDLMSQRLVVKQSGTVGTNDVGKVVELITTSLDSLQDKRKLLKLTNFANHSVVYLIGPAWLHKYETIASQDSNTIVYNDILKDIVTESEPIDSRRLREVLHSGVSAITSGGKNELIWEIHEATTLERFRERVEDLLRQGTTEISIGLAFAAHEKAREVRERGFGSMHGLDLDHYQNLHIPLTSLASPGGSVLLYEYSDNLLSNPLNLTPGAFYRMNAQGRWAKVSCAGVGNPQHFPEWMTPCGGFVLIELAGSYSRPQLRDVRPKEGEICVTMQTFVFQVLKRLDLRLVLTKPQSADYPKDYGEFTIVCDPFWETGGLGRKIIYKPKQATQ